MTLRKTALLGSETLAGRELIERLEAAHVDLGDFTLAEPGGEHGVIAAVAGALRVSTPRVDDAVEGADLVLVCAPLDEDDAELVAAAAQTAVVLDLTGTLSGTPIDGLSAPAGESVPPGLHASSSGAALLVAALARSARAAGASTPGSAVVFAPASELGQEALDELYAQAIAVLNFAEMPMAIFGRQAVHDVVSPGAAGKASEDRLRREVAGLVSGAPPAVLVVQAGTFHGTAVAFHSSVDPVAWRGALAAEPRLAGSMKASEEALATPLSCVRAESAVVGRLDSDGCGGAWAFAAADTLAHGAVGNAVAVVRRLTGGNP